MPLTVPMRSICPLSSALRACSRVGYRSTFACIPRLCAMIAM
ncbi:Uncharacterised protein [Bordetella pertussis]|nr:Uncharacterised protein [Bordetella pertussis]CPM14640.1 Uncharacterised protein [Bordetella pertussis]CPM69179.1 Uncharacterised protein [Bordetella pertussis]